MAVKEIGAAANEIRRPTDSGFGALDLFWNRDPQGRIEFDLDMLVPAEADDDFGVRVSATTTLLRYSVAFEFSRSEQRLILASENLVSLKKGDARAIIGFPHSKEFLESVVHGKRYGAAYISTRPQGTTTAVHLHQDGGSRGRPVPAGASPRTVLGGTNTEEYPTVVAARREMASWRSLQLEPSSLRTADRFDSPTTVDERGRHIASALRRLGAEAGDPARICAEVANRLSQLVDDVAEIRVREDEARQHRLVELRSRGQNVWHPPRALSDGTLRFLALIVMQLDSESGRMLCLEEPENGIHASRIPSLVNLLQDYAVDPAHAVDPEDNPLRQVLINSHSPDVVRTLDADQTLLVESLQGSEGSEARIRSVYDLDSWRTDADAIDRDEFLHRIGGLPRGQATLFGP
ncbi:MAG: AAA family ATPase [Planctomycetota bacterium JB042]